MRGVDKKTIIVMILLLLVAGGIIAVSEVSQSHKDDTSAFKETTTIESTTEELTETTSEIVISTKTTESTTTTTKPTTEPTTSTTKATTLTTTKESTTKPVETTEKTTEETTKKESSIKEFNNFSTSVGSVNRKYTYGDYFITFNPSKEYSITDKNNINSFTGTFDVYSFDDAERQHMISKRQLRKVGLNYYKINPSNLYYIKAYYGTHVYGENTEYYSKELMGDKYFEFLVYFRSDGKACYVAINNIDEKISKLDINKSYF